MSKTENTIDRVSLVFLSAIEEKHSDKYGRLNSTAALSLMGSAALAVAGSATGQPFVALSTERVAFLEPVPVGHSVAFRSELVRTEDGKARVSVEGLTRFQGDAEARCVMTGRFLLIQVEEDGQAIPPPAERSAMRVA